MDACTEAQIALVYLQHAHASITHTHAHTRMHGRMHACTDAEHRAHPSADEFYERLVRAEPSNSTYGRTHAEHGRMHARTHARTDGRTDGQTHAHTHARTDGRMDGRMHARTHTRTHAHTHTRTHTLVAPHCARPYRIVSTGTHSSSRFLRQCTCLYACLCACPHTRLYACAHTCLCAWLYTGTRTCTRGSFGSAAPTRLEQTCRLSKRIGSSMDGHRHQKE